jgi:hypothetical protein
VLQHQSTRIQYAKTIANGTDLRMIAPIGRLSVASSMDTMIGYMIRMPVINLPIVN